MNERRERHRHRSVAFAAATVLVAAWASLWIAAHARGDLLVWTRTGGTVWGIVNTPSQIVLFRNHEPPVPGRVGVAVRSGSLEHHRGAKDRSLDTPLGIPIATHSVLMTNLSRDERPWLGSQSFWIGAYRSGTLRGVTCRQVILFYARMAWIVGAAWIAAVVWYWRGRMRGSHQLGLCPHCGYDLRATPDRCPECGQTVPRPDAAADAP